MDEQIISAIEQRAKDNPGYKPNEKIYGQIRANAKTFESMSRQAEMADKHFQVKRGKSRQIFAR